MPKIKVKFPNSMHPLDPSWWEGYNPSPWSVKDDETLIRARAQGLNWNQIGPKHFPIRTPNACRKRHERLIERQNAERWDSVKLDVLAQAYMEVRRDMWSMLAARVGEKWQLVETKCMEKGLKNLTQAFRSAQKKLGNGMYPDLEDEPVEEGTVDIVRTEHTEGPCPDELATRPLNLCSVTRNRYRASNNTSSASNTDQLGFRDLQSDAHAEIQPNSNFIMTVSPSSTSTADASTQTSAKNVNESGRIKSEADLSNHDNTGVLHPTISVGSDQVGAVRPLLQYENIEVYQREGWCRDSTPLIHAQDTRNDEIVDSLRAQDPKGYTISTKPGSLMRNDCPSSKQKSHLSKEQASGQLMARSHNVPTTLDTIWPNECAKPETTNPSKDPAHASQRHLDSSAKKRIYETLRKGGGEDPNSDEDDGNNNGSKKRRKKKKHGRSTEPSLASPKRFACPYFKHDPYKDRTSRACSGPGFLTIAKLKDHLYRVHPLPLHCKRCYTTFVDDTGLTAHSRSAKRCIVTDAKLIEGFNNEQLLKLKSKQSMHQAGSEENQWKFVYCVLFPDTILFEVPSPHYGDDAGVIAPWSKQHFPEAPDLTQFEAYLCRELPRKVRKACWAAMEKEITPMDETLKNEIENIVRGCLQDLSRAYLDSVRARATGISETTKPKQAASSFMLSSQDRTQDECYPHSRVVPSYWHDDSDISISSTFLGRNDSANWTTESQPELLHSSFLDPSWLDSALTEDTLGTILPFEFPEPAQVQYDIGEHAKEDLERGMAAD